MKFAENEPGVLSCERIKPSAKLLTELNKWHCSVDRRKKREDAACKRSKMRWRTQKTEVCI